MAWEQDGVVWQRGEDLLQLPQRVLIDLRGRAAADRAGEERVSCDEHRLGKAADEIAEGGIRVA